MRILIAEDEPLEADALGRRLEALGPAVVDTVYDGSEAVAKAEALCPDLILLDLRMPKLDGITAAEKILAARAVPIILLTGQSDPALLALATRAGVMGHLVKPVDGSDVKNALTLAMRRFAEWLAQRADGTAE